LKKTGKSPEKAFMTHLILLPVTRSEEITRFKIVAEYLHRSIKNMSNFEFLLMHNGFTDETVELLTLLSKVAPVKHNKISTTINSYPEGPAYFFWESMGFINRQYIKDSGFVLWMESDMVPTKSNWVDRLDEEWTNQRNALVMGLYLRRKYIVKTSGFLPEHINGGACYSKNIAAVIPPSRRGVPYDETLFKEIRKSGRYRKSNLFKFSALSTLVDDIENERVAILHGYRQNKTLFVNKAIKLLGSKSEQVKEKAMQSRLPRVERICCDFAVIIGSYVDCPFHERDTALVILKNNILGHLMQFVYCVSRELRLIYSRLKGKKIK
jgi:hypothetical protein